MARTIFVTGTDTGVGKTVFSASLVHVLRSAGIRAQATKPFCSGTRNDVKLLQCAQAGELTDAEVNPFYFPESVAPLVALRKARRNISLRDVIAKIEAMKKHCDVLVIEGSGGLMVPLGKGFMVADVIHALKSEVVIVSRNRLGTINHTLLTTNALKERGAKEVTVVLMEQGKKDESCASNLRILREMLEGTKVVSFPFLRKKPMNFEEIRRSAKILKKVLAAFWK
jgi:dethiobiotin synthetase